MGVVAAAAAAAAAAASFEPHGAKELREARDLRVRGPLPSRYIALELMMFLQFQTVERQLRSLIREHHRLIEAAEQLGSPAADSKLRAATRIQQEIINKAYQLKH
ncbi:hypothetical protein BIW11_01279, partial [Tropilaelaps mercedesae]